MYVRVMLVPDVVEEVYLVSPREERCGNAVHRGISPALK
jgi:hypothetical protein